MCSKRHAQQHSISHGPACLQSLNQPSTTEHRLFIFHSTKDLEIYHTWSLGPHSTVCQSIFPSEEKQTQERQRLCVQKAPSTGWLTTSCTDLQRNKDWARISDQWYAQNNISKCISENQWKQFIQDYLNHPQKAKKQKPIKWTHSSQQKDCPVSLHMERKGIKGL